MCFIYMDICVYGCYVRSLCVHYAVAEKCKTKPKAKIIIFTIYACYFVLLACSLPHSFFFILFQRLSLTHTHFTRSFFMFLFLFLFCSFCFGLWVRFTLDTRMQEFMGSDAGLLLVLFSAVSVAVSPFHSLLILLPFFHILCDIFVFLLFFKSEVDSRKNADTTSADIFKLLVPLLLFGQNRAAS